MEFSWTKIKKSSQINDYCIFDQLLLLKFLLFPSSYDFTELKQYSTTTGHLYKKVLVTFSLKDSCFNRNTLYWQKWIHFPVV